MYRSKSFTMTKCLLHVPAPHCPYYLQDKHGGCWVEVPPAFKHFLCGFNLAAAAQWLTVLAVYHDNPVANDNTTARQEQHWFTHNSPRPRSQHVYVEVCVRVARSSGDIYTSRPQSTICPDVSVQPYTSVVALHSDWWAPSTVIWNKWTSLGIY